MFSNVALLSLYENTIDVNILKYPQKTGNVTATKQTHIYSSEIFITIFTTQLLLISLVCKVARAIYFTKQLFPTANGIV